jgi:hypothetical protein
MDRVARSQARSVQQGQPCGLHRGILKFDGTEGDCRLSYPNSPTPFLRRFTDSARWTQRDECCTIESSLHSAQRVNSRDHDQLSDNLADQ